jgi:hypothetical protein
MPFLQARDETSSSMFLKCDGIEILFWWIDKNLPSGAKFTQDFMKVTGE